MRKEKPPIMIGVITPETVKNRQHQLVLDRRRWARGQRTLSQGHHPFRVLRVIMSSEKSNYVVGEEDEIKE